jgi:ubiquinone biosynthesis protein
VIQESLTRELGPLEQLGIKLEPAIAEASVAVVLPFSSIGSGGGGSSESGQTGGGVLKLLKPGIERQLEHELCLLGQVGEYLDNRCDDLQIPHLDYQESFELARDKLLEEVQLEHEQRHLVLAQDFFADEPRVHVPRLWEHCTPRVTAMERLSGGKVTEHLPDSQRACRRLAGLIAKALIAKPILTRRDLALFHGDPHAGNLFLTNEGRLGILDWSLVGNLGVWPREAIVQIILAAITLDAQRVAAVLGQLDEKGRAEGQALRSIAEAWTKRIRRGQFPGLGWLVGLLDESVQRARLRGSADLMLFRKSLLTLEGVVADVGPSSGQLERTLLFEFVRQFAAEYPLRPWQPPNSRDFSTRISNLDLMRTLLSSPFAATRFWSGHTFDILEACAKR